MTVFIANSPNSATIYWVKMDTNKSLKQLEFELLAAALDFVRSDAENVQCERMEAIVNKALVDSKNILIKALETIKAKSFHIPHPGTISSVFHPRRVGVGLN